MFGGYIKVKNFVPRLPHYKSVNQIFISLSNRPLYFSRLWIAFCHICSQSFLNYLFFNRLTMGISDERYSGNTSYALI